MHQQILELLRGGDAAAAVALARSAVAGAPDDPSLRRLLAAALRADGDVDAARDAIEAALARFPESAELHVAQAALMLDAGDLAAASDAFARGTTSDPNQFAAYVMQAQLALARGDGDEAARLLRLSARIDPGHPWQAMAESLVALRRGHAADALSLASRAQSLAPEDGQVLHALGLAYLANDHLAFAEQVFLGLVERQPQRPMLRALVADIQRRQGRPDDAAAMLAPLFDADASLPPDLFRYAGELELARDRPQAALPFLRRALALMPGDARTLGLAMTAWQRGGDPDDARGALDAALATSPADSALWRARLSLESPEGDAIAVQQSRWEAAMPDDVAALEAGMNLHAFRGDAAGAAAYAARVVAIAPGHPAARWRLFMSDALRDPAATAASLALQAGDAGEAGDRERLMAWSGLAHDMAGDTAAAVAAWRDAARGAADARVAPPAITSGTPALPGPASAPPAGTAPALFLFGPPGSQVERLAATMSIVFTAFRQDRFGGTPPADALQDPSVGVLLAEGRVAPGVVADAWRRWLPARGIAPGGPVIDWLLHWDAAMAAVVAMGIPEAELAIVVRDPRDMLLGWLASPAPLPLRFEDAAAADWLARLLDQVADLVAAQPFPVRLVRLDAAADEREAVAAVVGGPADVLARSWPAGLAAPPPVLPDGRWRAYAGELGDAFDRLAGVVDRLGYPRD